MRAFPQQRRLEIIAHRGASHDAPENTLTAARLAWDQGADAIEFDVRLTKDSQVVAFHDADSKRITGSARLVRGLTLAELRTLDAGRWKGVRFAGERIPTLAEMLAEAPPHKRVFIEIKDGPETVAAMAPVVRAAGLDTRRFVCISFDGETLKSCDKEIPGCEKAWIRKGPELLWQTDPMREIFTLLPCARGRVMMPMRG